MLVAQFYSSHILHIHAGPNNLVDVEKVSAYPCIGVVAIVHEVFVYKGGSVNLRYINRPNTVE